MYKYFIWSKLHFLLVLILILSSCIPQKTAQIHRLNIPEIKVLLAKNSTADTIQFKGTFYLDTEEARYEFGPSNNSVIIEPVKTGYRVYNSKRMFLFRQSDNISFLTENGDDLFIHKNRKYSGTLSLTMQDSSNILFINKLDLESYLKGVVPAEIFTDRAEYLEAIKAQTICARTYALQKMNETVKKPFNVFDDTRDQVYGGSGIRTSLGDLAVDETTGSVLMYGESLARTFFHTSCGGILETADNVWSGKNEPYITSHQDLAGNQFADKDSPYFRWTETRSITQLDSMYHNAFGVSYLDDVVSDTMYIPFKAAVNERTLSGRAKKMTLQYGTDLQTLERYEIRRFFGWPIGTLLPSTLFRLETQDSMLVIKGAGNGHGVGLCQYGAMYKSVSGLQYYHILNSYFTGTVLKKYY